MNITDISTQFIIDELQGKTSPTKINSVYAIRYTGDFIGLLLALNLDNIFHEAVMIINGIHDTSMYSHERYDVIHLPIEGIPEIILEKVYSV